MLTAHKYTCGFCNSLVASNIGILTTQRIGNLSPIASVYICPNCTKPTFVDHVKRIRVPRVAPGNPVQHLPTDVEALYNEARNAIAANAYTASVLACRKLLMNIAVSLGAEAGESFVFYVTYLEKQNYIPPNGRAWVDHIRTKGNEATHEIALMSLENAEELIVFAEMLLKFVFEFPARVPRK